MPSALRSADPFLLSVAGLTVLAAAIRFSTLGVQEYWGDEKATVDLLHVHFSHLLSAIQSNESTPPLYYLLA